MYARPRYSLSTVLLCVCWVWTVCLSSDVKTMLCKKICDNHGEEDWKHQHTHHHTSYYTDIPPHTSYCPAKPTSTSRYSLIVITRYSYRISSQLHCLAVSRLNLRLVQSSYFSLPPLSSQSSRPLRASYHSHQCLPAVQRCHSLCDTAASFHSCCAVPLCSVFVQYVCCRHRAFSCD